MLLAAGSAAAGVVSAALLALVMWALAQVPLWPSAKAIVMTVVGIVLWIVEVAAIVTFPPFHHRIPVQIPVSLTGVGMLTGSVLGTLRWRRRHPPDPHARFPMGIGVLGLVMSGVGLRFIQVGAGRSIQVTAIGAVWLIFGLAFAAMYVAVAIVRRNSMRSIH